MTMNFPLPDWVPWWVPLVLLLPALLYALAFLFMPFSVIGLKSRLEGVEARLDEIQHEIRHLSLRLPEVGRAIELATEFDGQYTAPPAAPRVVDPPMVRPPIPPAAHSLYNDDLPEDRPPPPPNARPNRRGVPPTRQEPRAEPRLNWPR